VIFGRVKFRVSEVEPWLEAHGHLVRCGVATLETGRISGSAVREHPEPGHEE
jgi:hypothetical protein